MLKKDPPILVTRPSLPPVEEYESLVREIFSSRYLTNGGAQHQKLEAALKKKLGTPYLRLFSNGHLALECAIQALNLAPGEIITTPLRYLHHARHRRCGFTPYLRRGAGLFHHDPDE
jgi:dTDP-4-amino-4,6-dideoxygalactose transaminase